MARNRQTQMAAAWSSFQAVPLRLTDKGIDYEVSSGNVFADLGLPHSDELLAKAALAHQITSIASHRHLTQSQTAAILGTTQPKVSDLFAGKLAGFSMERLMRYLNELDRDVRIVVTPKPRSRSKATTSVTSGPAPRTRAAGG